MLSTAKACPAEFLQRWSIFAGDFVDIGTSKKKIKALLRIEIV